MALKDLLIKGSQLTQWDGKTPKSYDGVTQYEKSLATSQLDLDGKTPLSYDRLTQYQKSLATSQLDLDGKTPERYLDNLPG
jgi:hypothetical protein